MTMDILYFFVEYGLMILHKKFQGVYRSTWIFCFRNLVSYLSQNAVNQPTHSFFVLFNAVIFFAGIFT